MTDAGDGRGAILAAMHVLGWTLADLWMRCYGLGAHLSMHDLSLALDGRRPLSSAEHDVVCAALNDGLIDAGADLRVR